MSGNPSVVGDVYDDQWSGMFETDIYGRPIWEDIEVADEYVEHTVIDENGHEAIKKILIEPAHIEHREKLNPNYDGTQEYKKRSERPEWDAVGMLGKLVMIDDGTCKVDQYCKPFNGGIATHSEDRTKYRVMERLDETHIRVLVL